MANLGNTIINGALRVNGKINSSDVISAPSFVGALTGNADTATNIQSTLANPSSESSYCVAFHPSLGTGVKSLKNNNGLLYVIESIISLYKPFISYGITSIHFDIYSSVLS